MQSPPPKWLTEWGQLVLVQVVGAAGLLIAGWKYATKPIRSQLKVLDKRLRGLRREFKADSFEVRNAIAIPTRIAMENEAKIARLEEGFDTLREEVHELVTEYRADREERLRADGDVKAILSRLETLLTKGTQ